MLEKRKPFVFKKISSDVAREHASGVKGSLFKPQYAVLRPKAQDTPYRIRFMPPTWEEPKHFGYAFDVHSNIGADKEKFVCLKYNGEDCPACAESKACDAAGEEEAAYSLKAKGQFAYWVIQRGLESKGPQLFVMRWKFDQNMSNLYLDEDTGEVICVYSPKGGEDGGRDMSFKCAGKYKDIEGMKFAQRSTPLTDDPAQYKQWLQYIQDNPVPKCFKFPTPEYVAKLLGGTAGADTETGEQAEEPAPVQTRAKLKIRKPVAAETADDLFDTDDLGL